MAEFAEASLLGASLTDDIESRLSSAFAFRRKLLILRHHPRDDLPRDGLPSSSVVPTLTSLDEEVYIEARASRIAQVDDLWSVAEAVREQHVRLHLP
eukprot:CAMPEP_0170630882 /NCGR_PEP_ID=MMETSP0224-20130122/34280_1 /TAXON_ID=285029 /ORGANISM="Togula jolla, Strain CCCM 725" /LENGTH=96 /DNA_ID=CAMNT_0010959055 /DNA_START=761 /DNA_END=1052 /DNA_ORIENTATION=+